MSRTGKSMETDSRWMVSRAWEEEGQGTAYSVGTGFSAEVMKMFWNLVEVAGA